MNPVYRGMQHVLAMVYYLQLVISIASMTFFDETKRNITFWTPIDVSWPGCARIPSSSGCGILCWWCTTTRAPDAPPILLIYSISFTFNTSDSPVKDSGAFSRKRPTKSSKCVCHVFIPISLEEKTHNLNIHIQSFFLQVKLVIHKVVFFFTYFRWTFH